MSAEALSGNCFRIEEKSFSRASSEYNDVSRRLRYANCGHLPALLLRRDGSLERLNSTATVLGLFAQWDCALEECQLFPGDTLFLYTDGATESFNDSGEEFGDYRLTE